MGVEIIELGIIDFSLCASQGQGDLRVAHIERVEKWLMMDERGIIDIQRDFADQGERLFTVLVIKDAHIPCDQAAERVQS